MLQPKGLRRTAQTGLWGRLTALLFNRPITEPHHLRRPEDMVVLDFEFENMALELGKHGRRMKPARPWKPSYMRVYFPPQHIGESRYQTVNPGGIPYPAVEARMSGVSWLVFRRPAEAPPTAFTAEGLIRACAEWPLVLSPNAAPAGEPGHAYTLADFADAHRLDLSDAKLDAVAQDLASSSGRVAGLLHAQAAAKRPQPAKAMRRWATEADRATARAAQRLGLASPAADRVVRATFDRGVVEKGAAALEKLKDYGLGVIDPPPAPAAPERPDKVTAIELPWRLRLSPTANGQFLGRPKPYTVNGRAELWHLRLTRQTAPLGRPAESTREPPTVRAIWSPDWPGSLGLEGDAQDQPFKGPMNKRDRAELVSRMGDYTLSKAGGGAYVPTPATARRLELSALGGSTDLEGRWTDDVITTEGQVANLAAWAHKAELGRDSRVVVVRTGYLYPFGVRCSVTDVTERKIVRWAPKNPATGDQNPEGGADIAALVTKSFLSIGEPLKRYEAGDLPLDGRAFPFAEIEVLDGVTPIETSSASHYWPTRVGETDHMSFHLRARDHAGRQASFRMPLVFVLISQAYSGAAATIDSLNAFYRSGGPDSNKARRTADFHGARVRLAAADDAGVDSLSFAVESVTFDADPLYSPAPSGGLHRFRPKIELASVEAPGAAQFAGGAPPVEVAWHDAYLSHGFGGTNPGEVALKLTKPLPLFSPGAGGSSEKAGALATPRLSVHGFSRKTGAVTGKDQATADDAALAAVSSGAVDYATLLPDMKLFGVFPIADLLQGPKDGVSLKVSDALALKVEETPTAHVASLNLRQAMKTLGSGVTLSPVGASYFSIDAKVVTPKDGGAAGQSVTASLDAFEISFFGMIALRFKAVRFITAPGKKPDVVLDFSAGGPLVFTGDLAFLQKLADILPTSAFSDPPDLQITPEGLTAGFSLGLPPIAVGAVSLTNISFGAAFRLPFLGDRPSLRLNFADRDAPFGVIVSLLGGGGFFAMELDTGGVRVIEGSIEAQAGIAINLGVAAGAVTARLGIYYRWQLSPTETVYLEAFAELRGELCVLGLISVSITFHVGLGILAHDGRKDLIGTATVTVEVEVLFFSKSVGIECHREFQGSNGDPTFADVFPAPAIGDGGDAAWSAYADAFA
jgi:hypothetical protein